jgi:hypothetical protein
VATSKNSGEPKPGLPVLWTMAVSAQNHTTAAVRTLAAGSRNNERRECTSVTCG